MLCIAPTARISPLADIEDSRRGTRIVVEDDVVIDSFVKIKPAGGSGDLVIGRGSVINAGCVLYTGHGIRLGANVLVAANCTFAPTNHACADPTRPIRAQGFQPSRGGIVIGDDVWIGANTVLVDGARIGAGSVIGAASLVRGELPAFCIAFGVPAEVRGWRGTPAPCGPSDPAAPPAGAPSADVASAGVSSAAAPAAGTPSAGAPAAGTPSIGTPSAGAPSAGTPSTGTPSAAAPSATGRPA